MPIMQVVVIYRPNSPIITDIYGLMTDEHCVAFVEEHAIPVNDYAFFPLQEG